MKTGKMLITLGLTVALTTVSCEQRGKDGRVLDTPTSGEIRILVDEAYQPVIASALDVFDTIYPRTNVQAGYVAEGEAVAALLRDSVQVIIIGRALTDEEVERHFKPRGFTPKMTLIAYDAPAFIVHPENRDTLLTAEQLRQIVTGQKKRWSDVNPRSPLGDIVLVFDHPLSGTVRYVRDSIGGGAALPQNAFAVKGNAEVIDYVSKHKNALGIIGVNWVSDSDDKGVQSFRQEIRLVDIASAPGKEGFGPYQAYLATGQYPYRRSVYVINAQARTGLGLGVASFLASDPGQRIIQKDGLLAAQAPIRLIQLQRK
ncbi:MAG: substrate-binding domain-containing protein [Saprospiraceae bacterium]|nr:substrate-binding domain-containing protein [Saprospiraceae bacterium]MDW8229099.1 substrate-binding domain-containing protein [Saprospiraceae bacterium]